MSQTYETHRRWVPMWHFFGSLLGLAILIGSGVNLFGAMGSEGLYSASLIAAISVLLIITFFFERTFALKAQDRAIRAEENFRHYVLTGKPLDSSLTTRQIIGLRFASDGELADLAKKAAAESLSEDDIKKAVKNWRSDTYRV